MHPSSTLRRRLPVGAELARDGVHCRVWAPASRQVAVVLEESNEEIRLAAESGGYFSGLVPGARAGSRYRYRLDDGNAYPDPASRFQPDGPSGPSEVIDPAAFRWTDHEWRGLPLEGQVVYEMHVGTFSPEGTWDGAIARLPLVADAGVSVLEVMPVAEFPGRFGWGYDGVDLFAPTRLYGRPDQFRRFVDRAHALGLAVLLDVVYNHFGPDGNFTSRFSPAYFSDRYENEWGDALNFDGKDAAPVREFFVANAGYWIDEFHLDGLRLDATQTIHDASREHVLASISRRVREAGGRRRTLLVAENEPQHVKLVRPIAEGGDGLDALWNDDFHHTAIVAVTGRRDAYYTDHRGTPQEFVSSAKWGYLFQGQHYAWQHKARGMPAFGIEPARLVNYVQNHDQIANSGRGERLHMLTSPGRYRAMTALLLLLPGTPMLFQGQEFAADSPFFYFADHGPDLAEKVRQGRSKFLSQFRTLATPEMQACLTDPASDESFERSKLRWDDRERRATVLALHRDLIALRRRDPAFRAQRAGAVDGAVLGPEAFVLRFFDPAGHDGDRLLLVNFGTDLMLDAAPEPLLAPPLALEWQVAWSTEDPRYGGCGTVAGEVDGQWTMPGHAAVVLAGTPAVSGK